jgi:hypothetical protein
MRHALYAVVLLLLVMSVTTVLGATASPVSRTTATIPASLLGPETDLDCITATEQAGSTVTASLVCYDWSGPALHLKDIQGTVSQGVLVLPIWDCEEPAPGFAASLAMAVNLSSGVGWLILVQDLTAPLTCTGSALYGPLTMTALPENHDEDGDGCSDRNELYSDRDPFNPNDCGTGGEDVVGGIAEMPALTAEVTTDQAWGYLVSGAFGIVFIGILVAVGLEVVRRRK